MTEGSGIGTGDAQVDDAALAEWRAASLDHWLRVALGDTESPIQSRYALEAELQQLKSSASWRITAPLRGARKWLR